MLLAVPVAWFLYHQRYDVTFVVFFIAAITDGLDGYIAKRFNWTSELGKLLDPLAYNRLLVTVFVTLALIGKVAPWLVTLVVARDVIIAVGATIYRRMAGSLVDTGPTWISKVNTVVQISYVLAAISASSVSWPGPQVISMLGYLTAGTTIISGADYIITYSKRAAALHRQVTSPES